MSTTRKSTLYTRRGDDGTSAVIDGKRQPKSAAVFAAVGAVDELNAAIGVIVATSQHLPIPDQRLLRIIQHQLITIGAVLGGAEALLLPMSVVRTLELAIDRIDAGLPPLRQFILPGGAAATCHVARTVCRRTERALAEFDGTPPAAHAYINRLSDYLFALARQIAFAAGEGDAVWQNDESST